MLLTNAHKDIKIKNIVLSLVCVFNLLTLNIIDLINYPYSVLVLVVLTIK